MIAPLFPLRRPAARRQRGVSLVELMVGLAIGMVVVAGMSVLFANNSRTRAETEKAGQKIENGRYALDLLRTDLQHAGYLAEFDPRQLPLSATRPDICATDLATLKAALGIAVSGHDNATSPLVAELNCLSDVVPGTDVMVLRRAATCIDGSANCPAWAEPAPIFQASSCEDATELGGIDVNNYYRLADSKASLTLRKRDCTATADMLRYVVRIYYVAANDKDADGIPTLKRAELVNSGTGVSFASVTSMVQGVENLQIEYGLDTSGDGIADVYAPAPGTWCAAQAPVIDNGTCWSAVVSAKLSLLTRSLEPGIGYTDTRSYVLGQKADATGASNADNGFGPFNDRFRRSVFQSVVRLENVAGRRSTP